MTSGQVSADRRTEAVHTDDEVRRSQQPGANVATANSAIAAFLRAAGGRRAPQRPPPARLGELSGEQLGSAGQHRPDGHRAGRRAGDHAGPACRGGGRAAAGRSDLITGLRRALDPRSWSRTPDLADLYRPVSEQKDAPDADTVIEVTLLGLSAELEQDLDDRLELIDPATGLPAAEERAADGVLGVRVRYRIYFDEVLADYDHTWEYTATGTPVPRLERDMLAAVVIGPEHRCSYGRAECSAAWSPSRTRTPSGRPSRNSATTSRPRPARSRA